MFSSSKSYSHLLLSRHLIVISHYCPFTHKEQKAWLQVNPAGDVHTTGVMSTLWAKNIGEGGGGCHCIMNDVWVVGALAICASCVVCLWFISISVCSYLPQGRALCPSSWLKAGQEGQQRGALEELKAGLWKQKTHFILLHSLYCTLYTPSERNSHNLTVQSPLHSLLMWHFIVRRKECAALTTDNATMPSLEKHLV